MGFHNIMSFGAVSNGIFDNFTQFTNALNAIAAEGGGTLYVPAGIYKISGTLRIHHATIIYGDGFANSTLRFEFGANNTPSSLGGILIEPAMNGNKLSNPEGSVIRDLTLDTGASYSPNGLHPKPIVRETIPPQPHNGITIRTSYVTVENCKIQGFQEDGIRILPHPELIREANSWQITRTILCNNGQNGIQVSGEASFGTAKSVTLLENCRWGISDDSVYGNTYIMCNCNGNGKKDDAVDGGPYRTRNPFARSAFVGCQALANQNQSAFRSPSTLFGGYYPAGLQDAGSVSSMTVMGTDGFTQFEGPLALGIYPIPSGIDPNFQSKTVHLDHEKVTRASVYLADGTRFDGLEVVLPTIMDNSSHKAFAGNAGHIYTVKKVDARTDFPIIVRGDVAVNQRIDGKVRARLTKPYSWITVIAEIGTRAWYIIAGEAYELLDEHGAVVEMENGVVGVGV